jgi:hypothetical protein
MIESQPQMLSTTAGSKKPKRVSSRIRTLERLFRASRIITLVASSSKQSKPLLVRTFLTKMSLTMSLLSLRTSIRMVMELYQGKS